MFDKILNYKCQRRITSALELQNEKDNIIKKESY